MINYLIPFLIGFSLVVAGILLFIKNGKVRGLIVYPSIGIIVITVMILLGFYVNGTTFPTYENAEWVNNNEFMSTYAQIIDKLSITESKVPDRLSQKPGSQKPFLVQ